MLKILKSTENEISKHLVILRKSYENDYISTGSTKKQAQQDAKKRIEGISAKAKENKLLSVFLDEILVGFLWLVLGKQDLFIGHVFIYKRYRRKGYGMAVMKWIERFAKKNKKRDIKLSVLGFNTAAQELYRRSGYGIMGLTMRKRVSTSK